MNKTKTALLACYAITALSWTTTAQAQTRTFDVPAEDAVKAIPEFARQAGIQIVAPGDRLKGVRTPAIIGSLELHAALSQLLAGTGIEIASDDGQTIILRVPPKNVEAASNDGAAQGITETVVVTGTNIRGAANPTVPLIVLDRSYIESTGISTTSRLLESLPQNFARGNQSSSFVVPGVTDPAEENENINLRGIGEGTTLVLLNGRRMPLGSEGSAADISSLPLSAIDRVDVLTDGASAIYGSDAVGGVVNFVLRSDFDGAESQVHAGFTDAGADEYRASQIFGTTWNGGNALISGEYYKRNILLAKDRDFIPATSEVGSLLPRDEDMSIVFSGKQNLADNVTLFSDWLYTHRNSFNENEVLATSNGFARDKNQQLSGTFGFDWTVADDWQIEASGGLGSNGTNALFETGIGIVSLNDIFRQYSAELKADGTLFELPGGPVKLAIGGDWRFEGLKLLSSFGEQKLGAVDQSQTVSSAFGELSVPIVGDANAITGIRHLDLSLAGRYDSYSNFGSSIDPRVGLAWQPMDTLLFRGSWGTSYLAPKLSYYAGVATGDAVSFQNPDPGSPTGSSNILEVDGVDVASLTAQRSRSYTLGAEYTPSWISGLKLTLNYFNITYKGEIATPSNSDPSVVLNNPASFGSLLIRNPTLQQVNQYIAIGMAGQGYFNFSDPSDAPIDAIVDLRARNLSRVVTDGIDFSSDYHFAIDDSNVQLALNGSYLFKQVQQITATSAPFDVVNTVFNPAALRMRASAGWQRGGWSSNVFINFTNSYEDNRVSPSLPVSDYTTVDANVSYKLDNERGPLAGVTLSLSALNLLDQDPPHVSDLSTNGFNTGYDPANASPLGRLVSFDVTKRW